MGTRIFEIKFIYLKILIIFSIKNTKYSKLTTYIPNYPKSRNTQIFFLSRVFLIIQIILKNRITQLVFIQTIKIYPNYPIYIQKIPNKLFFTPNHQKLTEKPEPNCN